MAGFSLPSLIVIHVLLNIGREVMYLPRPGGKGDMHQIIFYPVGNGDTSQIVLDNGKRILFDFRHQKKPRRVKALKSISRNV